VIRGRRQDALKLSIPRCARCRNRNALTLCLVLGAYAVGAWAGSAVPSKGFMMIVGAAVCGVGVVFAVRFFEQRAGLHGADAYPPLRRLLAAGWTHAD
jgi:hypothetical protein